MKIKSEIIFLTFSMIILVACESEEIISPDVGFKEYTVVQAEIEPDKLFPAVRFTKTLPLGVPYDIKDAELKNVTAYLVKNEVQVIPLFYTANGLYKTKYDLYVNEGEIYELYAESEGKFIYGKTTIPHKPNVTSVSYDINGYYFDADVQAEPEEVYGALWIVSGIPPVRAEDYFTVTIPSSDPNNMVAVRTSSIPEEYRKPIYSGNRYIQVFSFDKSFRNYFYSRTSGQEINDPFIQGGSAVEWNMQGENVIGMFIGVAPGDILNVN
jgi:hypothetical protein